MTFDLWGRDCQKALVGARGHLPTKYELNRCSRLGGRLGEKCVGKEEKKEKKEKKKKEEKEQKHRKYNMSTCYTCRHKKRGGDQLLLIRSKQAKYSIKPSVIFGKLSICI